MIQQIEYTSQFSYDFYRRKATTVLNYSFLADSESLFRNLMTRLRAEVSFQRQNFFLWKHTSAPRRASKFPISDSESASNLYFTNYPFLVRFIRIVKLC